VLKDRFQSDSNEAAKAKDELRLSSLRMLQAALHNREIEKRTRLAKVGKDPEPLTEEEEIEVLVTEAKKRKEAAAAYEKAGRGELQKKEEAELAILSQYLPAQLSPEELAHEADIAIQATGASSKNEFGKVMAYLREKLKGKADFSELSRLVGEKLGNG